MNKTRSKKGFTLAELLIVVAIIAVLVAIAVPLFVGGLTKAQKARDDANIRAVRGAAVVYLLGNQNDTTAWPTTGVTAGWDVQATVTSSGEIKDMTIKANTAANSTDGEVTPQEGGSFLIKLHLSQTDVQANNSEGTP